MRSAPTGCQQAALGLRIPIWEALDHRIGPDAETRTVPTWATDRQVVILDNVPHTAGDD